MASIASQPRQQSGKLVAVEGDVNTVATQLRLLPPSPKILVLPSLVENLTQNFDNESFNARAFIRDVHTTFTDHTERALSFLQSSTTEQPRLVFMNGGSVSARAICISRICDNITNGDIGEAEIVFHEIVADGVAGLMKHEEAIEEKFDEMDHADGGDVPEKAEEKEDTLSLKPMKAGDSLDGETAEWQMQEKGSIEDPSVEKDTTTGHQGIEVSDCMNKTSTSEQEGQLVRAGATVPNQNEKIQERRNTFGPQHSDTPVTPATDFTSVLSHGIRDEYNYDCCDDYDTDLASHSRDSFFSMPPSPGVIYGEASIVDIPPVSRRKRARKVKSLGGFFPGDSGYRDWNKTAGLVKNTKSAYHLRRPSASNGRMERDESPPGSQTLPINLFMKAATNTMTRSPTASESRLSSLSSQRIPDYVDSGLDTTDVLVEDKAVIIESKECAPFEPVFAVLEDLVIHFVCDTPKEIFEYVISSYKNGSYPLLPPLADSKPLSIPVLPTSIYADEPSIRPASHLTTETDDDGFHRSREFDPYTEKGYIKGIKQWPLRDEISRVDGAVQNMEPPSPRLTPPPSVKGLSEKFCEFSPMNPYSAIGIQNSLRALLNQHFPAGDNGYTQHNFLVSPETDRLWKPVFRNDNNPIMGNDGRTVDQIIALGGEEGVKKDIYDQISGQIERLGAKRDGLNRSGKVDLRYFISNAMQTRSMLPLSIQSTSNLLSNPQILATLVVPQIEAYLATNASTRLLILQYPFNHLATVIALRNLLGQDVFKIAGIMDSLSSDPPSIPTRPGSSNTNSLSNNATASQYPNSKVADPVKQSSSIASQISSLNNPTHQPKKSESSVSFSKANYLLPSTATDVEITNFLSGILMSLVEKSNFYIPDLEHRLPFLEPPPLPPTLTAFTTKHASNNPSVSSRTGGQGRESKIALLTGNFGAGNTPRSPTSSRTANRRKYATSVASTARTTASEKARRIDKEWENFYIGDEDSEDDDYDRMVMGRAMARIVPEIRRPVEKGTQKRSTKKALKWLGLA